MRVLFIYLFYFIVGEVVCGMRSRQEIENPSGCPTSAPATLFAPAKSAHHCSYLCRISLIKEKKRKKKPNS